MKKKVLILLCAICLLLTACSSGSEEKTDVTPDSYGVEENGSVSFEKAGNYSAREEINEEMDAEVSDVDGGENAESNKNESEEADSPKETKAESREEKLVYTCNMSIETTEYEKSIKAIEDVIVKHDAIVDNQTETDDDYGWFEMNHAKTGGTKNCTYVIRVPSKNYKAFLKEIDGNGKIIEKNMNVENISRTYYDTEATIEGLKIQEGRLLKMMKEARTIEDMITVEDRLTQVQQELNNYKNQLSTMDTDVAYSTVTLHIKEVLEYTKTPTGKKTNTFYQRLVNTITASWTNFLLILEEILFFVIYLAPFALIVGIGWAISIPLRKKYLSNKSENRQDLLKKERKKRKENRKKESEDDEKF